MKEDYKITKSKRTEVQLDDRKVIIDDDHPKCKELKDKSDN